MAEQNFNQAIRIADRGYVIVHGKIAFEGKSADELNNNDLIRKFYWAVRPVKSKTRAVIGAALTFESRRACGCSLRLFVRIDQVAGLSAPAGVSTVW
jgi:hypothetical protein